MVTEGDIDILTDIHEYKLLPIEQIEVLTSRTYTRVHGRPEFVVAPAPLGVVVTDTTMREKERNTAFREVARSPTA